MLLLPSIDVQTKKVGKFCASGLFKFICLQRKIEIEMNKKMEKIGKVLCIIFCTLRFEMPFGVDKGWA